MPTRDGDHGTVAPSPPASAGSGGAKAAAAPPPPASTHTPPPSCGSASAGSVPSVRLPMWAADEASGQSDQRLHKMGQTPYPAGAGTLNAPTIAMQLYEELRARYQS